MRLDLIPFATVDEAREWARSAIDAAAGAARQRFITITPGQDATYLAKYNEALAYLRAGCPPDLSLFPWVAAEAAGTGLSGIDAATRIKAAGDPWHTDIGPRIEGMRVGGKARLAQCAQIADVLRWTHEVCQRLADLKSN